VLPSGVAVAAEGVKEWLDETRTLLRAAEMLVEWFTEEGSDSDEYTAFKACLDLPCEYLALIDEWLRVGDAASTRPSRWTTRSFDASRDVAQAISPLLERVVMYQPAFLQARRESDRIVMLWRIFIGELGRRVCIPIWEAYPEYAPPDWSEPPKT